MTATAIGAPTRADRRARLLNLIARATEELITIEAADRRAARLASVVVEPPAAEVAISDAGRVRAWARDHGIPVGPAGPIPKAARAAYDAAHPQEHTP